MTRRSKGIGTSCGRTLLVDGYNVINELTDLRELTNRSLETARNALLERCAAWLRTRRDVERVVVVFEGEEVSVPSCRATALGAGVRVVYTEKGETADDRIVNMVRDASLPAQCVVVTADRELAARTAVCGAKTIVPREFVETATRSERRRSASSDEHDGRGLSSRERAAINRELLRIWSK